jgi:hypothetical protein
MEKLPENWYIRVTEENIDVLDKWRKSVATKYLSVPLDKGMFVLSKHNDDSYFYSSNNEQNLLLDFPNYKKINFETFLQITQIKKLPIMSFTTITREQFKKGYNLACSEWKKTLMDKFGEDLILNDTIDVEHSFVDKLRSVASNDEQKEFLKELFPNSNIINAQQLKIGEAIKVTDTLYKDALLIRIYGGEFVNVLKPNQTWREDCSLNGIKVEFKVEIIEN